MRDDDSESVFLAHEPCPSCGSSDARSLYSDGHSFCFACNKYFPPEDGVTHLSDRRRSRVPGLLTDLEYKAIPARNLTEETCRKWGIAWSRLGDETVIVYNYRDPDGTELVAQHCRTKTKDFPWLGQKKQAGLYGQWLWRDRGKLLVITEGEYDAASVSQVQQHKWPVVSIKSGAAGAKKDVAKALDWILGFDEIVFMFDMDEEGQSAARECALLLPPGRAKIARLSMKDANELLKAGKGAEIVDAIWGAKVYRPEGIVTLSDLRDHVLRRIEVGLPWWSERLTELTFGRRYGEIYMLGAGTGVGKTDFLTQQIVHDITVCEQKVALFFLEQQPVETAKRVAGKFAGRRFHVPDSGWTEDELLNAFSALEATGRLYMFDHFGTAEWDVIEARIRYLAHAEGVRIFYIDHLTALADPSNERESLETIMGKVGGLVKELDIIVTMVSHLSTPDGKPHEEGGRVMIRHFKGSRAIGFWSHFMFGLERDQQAEDENERHLTTFRVLKDRYTGQATGETFHLTYDAETGRLKEAEPVFEDYGGTTDDADADSGDVTF